MEPFKQVSDAYYKLSNENPLLGQVDLGFSTRNGGVSVGDFQSLNLGLHVGDDKDHVLNNREIFAKMINQDLSDFVFCEQIHGNKICHVDHAGFKGRGAYDLSDAIIGADGLVTERKDVVLAMFYADCVPLYFVDSKKGRIGLAHAGWQGTVKKIQQRMLDKFIKLGSDLKDIQVVIGPAIEKDHYQVNNQVISHVDRSRYAESFEEVPHEHDQYYLDLKHLNQQMLIDAGLNTSQIQRSMLDTFTNPHFYSYREHNITGRMIAYITLN